MLRALFTVFMASSLCVKGHSQVQAPNYNFSLDQLEKFLPNTPLDQLVEEFGPGEDIKLPGAKAIIKRYYVAHIRYKFPVFVQIQNDRIIDMFARLPSYFLHDVFHQSLINRYGKQQSYLNRDEHAVYQWKRENGMVHTYAGACAITCFPIYYTVAPAQAQAPSLFERMNFQAK